MLSISSGKRTCISLTIAGHADEISGLGQSRTDNWRFIACDTISAARATSNTSSKPSSCRAAAILPVTQVPTG